MIGGEANIVPVLKKGVGTLQQTTDGYPSHYLCQISLTHHL